MTRTLCSFPTTRPARSRKCTRRTGLLWTLAAGGALLGAAGTAQAQGPGRAPIDSRDARLKLVRLEQRLNNQLPVDTQFRDEDGREVRLHEYFGRKPVMLMLIQFRCTNLCVAQLQTLIGSLRELKFTPGKEFTLLIVSIDPRENAELAKGMKTSALEQYGRPAGAAGWHWLTGTQQSVDRLASAVGFHYFYDDRTDQYAHPDGVILSTPEGKIARYFFKLDYAPSGLRLGLVEAASHKIGTPLDAIALLCFHYNPLTGKYAVAIMRLVQLGAIVTVLTLAVGIGVMKRRERSVRLA